MPHGPPEHPARSLRVSLAAKLLQGWVQNRQQVRMPLTLNLGRMPAEQQAALRGLVGAALAACGLDHAEQQARWRGAAPRIGAAGLDLQADDLAAALRMVDRLGIAPQAYAAASVTLDTRATVERLLLEWLAERLALPPSLTRGLARRYRR